MENASKALIIAGAILLAILLISLGIMIFNQAQDTVSGSGMSEAEMQSFNNKFLKYEGNVKGTMVKSLIQEVLATNADSDNKDGIKVTVNGEASPLTKYVSANNTYKVVMEYEDTAGNSNNGRIKNVKVTYKNDSGAYSDLKVKDSTTPTT